MDWLPYLTQLARRPSALKYTGIYQLLPEAVQKFLTTCDRQTKKETLKILAKLSEESGFDKATEALKVTLEHGACDTDSLLAMFARLNSDILNLDPLTLSTNVPEMPSLKSDVTKYDSLFLKGGVNP